mmetsp:Transcript_111904/g.311487  ORF Transcript_111904/g.311487 Transcript_111904/m.311487 type:complete len:539 (+) Transcript_111904:978-2594(+)
MPSRVNAERIRPFAALVPGVEDCLVCPDLHALGVGIYRRSVPARGKEVEAKGEDVVVQHANVNGKEAHHKDEIPCFVQARQAKLQLICLPDGIDAHHQDHGPVADVAKHNTEEEGKCHDGEERCIGLLVSRKADRVDQVLEGPREVIFADVGRWVLPWHGPVRDQHGTGVPLPSAALDEKPANLVFLCLGVPTVCPEVHVSLKEIEGCIDGLLLGAIHAPLLYEGVAAPARRLQERGSLTAHVVLVLLQDPPLLLDLHLEAEAHLLSSCPAHWPAIRIDTVRRADLRDLLAHGGNRRPRACVLEVDDKDGLVHLPPCLRILHWLEDLLEVCEGVPSSGTPEGAREAVLLRLRDHPSDVTEHRLQRPAVGRTLLVVQQGARCSKLKLIPILAEARAGPLALLRRLGHGCDGRLHDVPLLQGRVPAAGELGIVFLEQDEALVDLLQARLDFVELVVIRVLQEAVDIVLDDLCARDLGQLVHQEPEDALHLVDALDVFLVGPVHVPRIHVLEHHLRVSSDEVDELPRAVYRQHKGAVLHRL